MGWHSLYDNGIRYNRGKTGGLVDLPLHANLEEFLINIPSHQKTFITKTKSSDESYTTEPFGNWFGKQYKESAFLGHHMDCAKPALLNWPRLEAPSMR
ncbi:hypothetical protein SAMN04488056_11262 [Cohaesibacter marisflavi]|uniref:Uncharacterized protein n=1 Tax=Cohaesibacter marisflavi TaxID=655353 RepID=A0A1I5JS43_9HYPH|nr:hypothetical protein SAMN04488056_11262 [Cohaesibacter marisflavi]